VVAAAYGLIGHSQYVQQKVLELRPDLPTGIVPMGVPLPPLIDQRSARRRQGIPQDALLLGSYGHVNAYKRLEPTLRAVRELRHELPHIRYVIVGSISPNFDVKGMVERMGLEDTVTITGFVDRAAFEDYVAAADICINLRFPTGGETSSSLFRLLGAGKPTLVSAVGAFAELPSSVAAQVDVDASESDLILAYVRLFAARPDLARQLGDRAREFVAREHTLANSAKAYARFLAQLYGWSAVQRHTEEPLWQIDTTPAIESAAPAEAAAPVDEAHILQELQQTTPDTSATDPHKYAALARALAETGVTEENDAVLRSVAEQIVALGLHQHDGALDDLPADLLAAAARPTGAA
jgi:hypothetical protein